MGKNILKLIPAIEYCGNNDQSAVVISVDFEKAFDTIKWEAINSVLDKFNIGPNLRQIVKIIDNETICITINYGKWEENC